MAKPPSRFSALEFEEHPQKPEAAAAIRGKPPSAPEASKYLSPVEPLTSPGSEWVSKKDFEELEDQLGAARRAAQRSFFAQQFQPMQAVQSGLSAYGGPASAKDDRARQTADDPMRPRTWASTIDPEWRKG